ncbi:hypothetical protein [Streptomyces sp. SID5770]|nr:hypothetical protein [Streptomyces sp. SID5770]
MTTLLICFAAVVIAYFSGKKKGIEIGAKEASQYIIEIKKKG